MRCSNIILIFILSLSGPCFGGPNEARQVFNKLVTVIGNTSIPKPSLLIMDNATLVAKTFPNGEVMLGKQFIRKCAAFGHDSMNAIACVLSHELVHYYQKHFWAQKFGSAYVDSDWGKKISEDENNKKFLELYETQADQLGFYYAFSAGYKTWQIGAALLDSTYSWYHLNENLAGYPSLNQRIEMVNTSAHKMKTLIPVFEMSNILKTISVAYQGDQQSALIDFSSFGYEHLISSNIQTAEIYNNIAVSRILKAQKFCTTSFANLQLPVVIDQASLMYEASGSKGIDEDPEKFTQLLNEASDFLDKALKLDENYWPASVNKSIVMLGLEKYGSCEDELNSKAIKNGIKNNARLIDPILAEIKGMLYFNKGEADKSKTFFNAAKKAGSLTAKTNMMLLTDRDAATSSLATGAPAAADTLEKWNGRLVYKGLKTFRTKTDNFINYTNTKAILLVDSLNGYKVYELKQKIGFCPVQYVKVAVLYDKELKTGRGLKAGDSQNDLYNRYGQPAFRSTGTLYSYAVYPASNLVVTINNISGKIENWFYYMLD